MKMSLGDIVDRYTIIKIKSERTNIDCMEELSMLKKEVDNKENIKQYVEDIYKINAIIWDLESDIRKGKEGLISLEEVGKIAIAIRDYNKIRVDIKNKIK